MENGGRHNERLEFLGDTVLALCVTDLLLESFPAKDEGQLSQFRHRLVNNENLARIAADLGLGGLLLLGRGEETTGGRERQSNLANCFEAMLGALYLSRGLEEVKWVVKVHFAPLLTTSIVDTPDKQILQEWAQKAHHKTPVYEVVAVTGPGHQQCFHMRVVIAGEVIAEGEGTSKRRATHAAAKAAVIRLGIK
jgi:ribonuclease III